MMAIMISNFLFQESSAFSKEGLPFWIFWLLLCVILLLVTFIFLRDKDLRQRLNSFLFKARRKMTKLRLQARIKKEKQKRIKLLEELGKRGWEEGIKPEGTKTLCSEIEALEKKQKSNLKEMEKTDNEIDVISKEQSEYSKAQEARIEEEKEGKAPFLKKISEMKGKEKSAEKELKEANKEIRKAEKECSSAESEMAGIDTNERLSEEEKKKKKRELEEKIKDALKKKEEIEKKLPSLEQEKAAIEKEREETQRIIAEYDQKIKTLKGEEKDRMREFEKKIKELRKNKEALQKENESMEKQKKPLFEKLGSKINDNREKDRGLDNLYTLLDKKAEVIRELERKVRDLQD